jgi:hypothetical protein
MRWLLSTVSDEDLSRQHDPIMSPLIWDYGHIGNYEELWLLEKAFGKSLSNRNLYDMYDASLHPREERPSLNLLDREGADQYLDAVREAVLEGLETADLEGDDPLLAGGFVYHMILQHECQHNESFPYREYSEIFFGPEYKVLRGGSWATRPHAIRNTFRNWDYPIRRQLFAGFRCAA